MGSGSSIIEAIDRSTGTTTYPPLALSPMSHDFVSEARKMPSPMCWIPRFVFEVTHGGES